MDSELIPTGSAVINGETVNAVNARELWKFLEVGRDFPTWFKGRVDEYGFEAGEDFSPVSGKSNGRPRTDYFITLDMAKELAMVENNEQGRRARQYFIEVEKRFRGQSADGLTRREVELIMQAVTPIIAEKERYKFAAELFSPSGIPGTISRLTGKPKNLYRRAYYTSGKGKHISAFVEIPDIPGIFERMELNQITGGGGR